MIISSCCIQCLEYWVGSLQDLFPGNCAGFFNVKRNQQTCGWGRTGIEPGTLWLQSHYAMGPPPFVDLKLSLLWYKYKYSTTTHYFMSTKACFMPDLSPCTRKHSRPRSLESSPRTRWSGKRIRWRRCPRTRWSSTAESTSSAWVVIQYCRDYWQLVVKFGQYIILQNAVRYPCSEISRQHWLASLTREKMFRHPNVL